MKLRMLTEAEAVIIAVAFTIFVAGVMDRHQHAADTLLKAKAARYGGSVAARFSLMASGDVVSY